MSKTVMLALAAGIAGLCSPAAAQNWPAINCGTPQNALTYYCNHRDQFDAPQVMVMPLEPRVRSDVVIVNPGVEFDIGTTGSIVQPWYDEPDYPEFDR